MSTVSSKLQDALLAPNGMSRENQTEMVGLLQGIQDSTGNLATSVAGKGLTIKEGSNARSGTAVLVGGTVVVSNTTVTALTRIQLTSQADGGTPGFLRVSTRSNGVSFTITSSSGTDTSTVAYLLVEGT